MRDQLGVLAKHPECETRAPSIEAAISARRHLKLARQYMKLSNGLKIPFTVRSFIACPAKPRFLVLTVSGSGTRNFAQPCRRVQRTRRSAERLPELCRGRDCGSYI